MHIFKLILMKTGSIKPKIATYINFMITLLLRFLFKEVVIYTR